MKNEKDNRPLFGVPWTICTANISTSEESLNEVPEEKEINLANFT